MSRKLKRTIGWKRIYYGQYEINRRGVIRRVTAASGTWPGRRLKPYWPFGSSCPSVRLYHGDKIYQVTVKALRARYFPQGVY